MNDNNIQLKNWLKEYEKRISLLEHKGYASSKEEIIAILTFRDVIHNTLSERKYESTEYIGKLIDLDNRLRKQSEVINYKINLPELRKSLLEKSWWFLEPPLEINFWNKYDRIWNFISIVLFIISLSILFDINSRIVAERPDIFGSGLVVIQSLLTSFFAGIILTKEAREFLSELLKSLRIPIYFHQEVQLIGAVLLLVIVIIFHFSLPKISEHYYSVSKENFSTENYRPEVALINAQRAIRINPSHLESYFLRGLIYEDLDEIEKSKKDYKIASVGGLIEATNNLARLHIIREDYYNASSLLTPLMSNRDKFENLDSDLKYALLKNLGWARFKQERNDEAQSLLEKAIAENEKKAPAHCLLAQILDSKKETSHALKEWNLCLIYFDRTNPVVFPEEDYWNSLASQRMKEFYLKK